MTTYECYIMEHFQVSLFDRSIKRERERGRERERERDSDRERERERERERQRDSNQISVSTDVKCTNTKIVCYLSPRQSTSRD